MKRFYDDITVTRTAEGVVENGRFTPGERTDITVKGLIQRKSPFAHSKGDAGRVINGVIVIFTIEPLQYGNGAMPDQVHFEGELFEVVNSFPFSRVKKRYRYEAYLYDDEVEQ